MIWHHGIPDASVVFLLLLFITPSGLGKDCFWEYRPFPTTDQSGRVKILKGWMLSDYQVSVPTNLKPDEFCQKLWDLYFVNRELVRMISVSGDNLTGVIKKLEEITKFVENCTIKESDCIQFERRNVTQFLDSILPLITAWKQHMEISEEQIDFSNCTVVQCQLDTKQAEWKTEQSQFFTTPDPKQAEQTTEQSQFFTAPDPRQTEQKTEDSQSSQAAASRKHYWWLILLPPGLLLTAFVVGTRLRRRQRSQNLQFEPPELL
ncbi:fms-related tyrosine kinase 3 ligand [Tiliqua scincoides]|uniref:fms-related tyrosine kinase 3 ligand n=1 Tax=Tiliqua scincoides TaxID=71010 RepID=UPI0034628EFB